MKVKKDMLIGDVVQKYPESAIIMMNYGLHCIGCHVSPYETIEQGCKGHGISDKKIDEIIKMINKKIESNSEGEKQNDKNR